VFIAMLVVYKTGAVKVTPKLTKWIIGATVGLVILMLMNILLMAFGVNMGIRGGGPLSIVFSLVVIGIAAFSFLLDFDMADKMIREAVRTFIDKHVRPNLDALDSGELEFSWVDDAGQPGSAREAIEVT